MKLIIDEQIRIELIEEKHAEAIFKMVDENRNYLRKWLAFVDHMQSVDFAKNFVKGTMSRNKDGQEFAFVIFEHDMMIGRIGVYKIDLYNSIGEIGYWIVENAQGKGIITKCCKVLMNFCFDELNLNRIEIKCSTENARSKAIPEKLHFKKEGIIRQGEQLYQHYNDLYLFSLLKSDLVQ